MGYFFQRDRDNQIKHVHRHGSAMQRCKCNVETGRGSAHWIGKIEVRWFLTGAGSMSSMMRRW